MKVTSSHSSTAFNIIAHRGISIYEAPENTILALKRALEGGFLIETDVQKAKDCYPLIHDNYILGLGDENLSQGRTKIETHYGNGFYFQDYRKPVSECTLNDLLTKTIFNKARLEAALSKRAGEPVYLELTEPPKIATLTNLIELLKKFPQSKVFLEIKRPDIYATYSDGMEEEIIGIICDNGLLENIIINSSNVSTLKNIRKANSHITISIDTDYADIPDLTHNMDEAKRMRDEIGISFWNPPFYEVDKKLLDDIEKLDLEAASWVQNETKKEELSEIRRLKSIGLRYLFTDQAEEALKIYMARI